MKPERVSVAQLDRASVCFLNCFYYFRNSIRHWWIITVLIDMGINILIREILQILCFKRYHSGFCIIISKYKGETGEKFCSGRYSVLSFCWKQRDSRTCMTEGAVYRSTESYMIIDPELPWAIHSWFQPTVDLERLLTPALQMVLVGGCASAWNVQQKNKFNLYAWKETVIFDNLQWRMKCCIVLKNVNEFPTFLRVEHFPSWTYGSLRLQQLFTVVKNRVVGILKSKAIRSEPLMSEGPEAKAILLFPEHPCLLWWSVRYLGCYFLNILWLCQNPGISIRPFYVQISCNEKLTCMKLIGK